MRRGPRRPVDQREFGRTFPGASDCRHPGGPDHAIRPDLLGTVPKDDQISEIELP